jgi:radical SAM superfamily enzyme
MNGGQMDIKQIEKYVNDALDFLNELPPRVASKHEKVIQRIKDLKSPDIIFPIISGQNNKIMRLIQHEKPGKTDRYR